MQLLTTTLFFMSHIFFMFKISNFQSNFQVEQRIPQIKPGWTKIHFFQRISYPLKFYKLCYSIILTETLHILLLKNVGYTKISKSLQNWQTLKIIISDSKNTGLTNSHCLWKLHVNCPSLMQYFCSWNARLIWSHLITQKSFLKKRQFQTKQRELELNKLAFKKYRQLSNSIHWKTRQWQITKIWAF